MSKYKNGYNPKIQYWSKKLSEATAEVSDIDVEKVAGIMSKLNYFVQREIQSRY